MKFLDELLYLENSICDSKEHPNCCIKVGHDTESSSPPSPTFSVRLIAGFF